MLTFSYLRSRLSYDPNTGVFTWLPKPIRSRYDKSWNTRYAGKQAGNIGTDGYVYIGIGNKLYYAHRLAWLYTYGYFPAAGLDHKNHDKADNRIDNLRPATQSQNNANASLNKRNTSGVKGVYHMAKANRWTVSLSVGGRTQYIGCFKSRDEAAEAYEIAASAMYGEFANPARSQCDA